MTSKVVRSISGSKIDDRLSLGQGSLGTQEDSSSRLDGTGDPSPNPVLTENTNAAPPTAGYLGSTSYLSVFNENECDVDIMHQDYNANIRGGSQSVGILG